MHKNHFIVLCLIIYHLFQAIFIHLSEERTRNIYAYEIISAINLFGNKKSERFY